MRHGEGSWTDRALCALADAGFRSGSGRRQVVELLGGERCALTALEIDRQLPEVGRATVYRALGQLEGLGLIQRVDVRRRGRLRRVDASGHHHHHIVCEQCGRVVAFEDEGLEQAILALAERPDFKLESRRYPPRRVRGL